MKMLSRRELAHVALMLGVLVVGVRCAGEEEVEGDEGHLTFQGGLLVQERRALAVCVELDPALKDRSEEVLKAVKADVEALEASHPDWEKAQYSRAPVRVQLGCPGAAMPSGRMEHKGALAGPGLLSRPSPFRTFVYVLDESKAQQVLGEQPVVRARAELMREDENTAVEVSTALVIRASTLGTDAFRETWLPMGMGLEPLREPTNVPSADSLK